MKQITAYKSNSGDLFEDENTAKIKDLVDAILVFVNDDYKPMIYDQYQAYRIVAYNNLSKRILENKDEFISLIRNSGL